MHKVKSSWVFFDPFGQLTTPGKYARDHPAGSRKNAQFSLISSGNSPPQVRMPKVIRRGRERSNAQLWDILATHGRGAGAGNGKNIPAPFWVVLVFGSAELASIKGEMGLSAREFGLKAVQKRKTLAIS